MPGGLQPYRLTASCLKTQLLGADRKPYSSDLPGSLGGNGKMKVYGRLDCSSARRAVAAGDTYQKQRVFFADEATAVAAGYRPCGNCLRDKYKIWRASPRNTPDHTKFSKRNEAMLTGRYDEAFRYAHQLHGTQTRKGTSIPYISHLMIVSALVVEHGGTEDQAIGALLHDAAEDQGGTKTLEEVRKRFGDVVAEIVSDCTDAWDEPKPKWRPRKEAYLAKLAAKPPRSLLVSLADKTHNAEAILYDFRVLDDALWDRFNGGAVGTRWYYRSLADIFSEVMPGPLSDRLSRAAKAFSSGPNID